MLTYSILPHAGRGIDTLQAPGQKTLLKERETARAVVGEQKIIPAEPKHIPFVEAVTV